MTLLPNGARALMSSRIEPPDSLEFFPTPPWATRALPRHVLCKVMPGLSFAGQNVLEPACGEGHMVETLRETFQHVFGSDIHDYGAGYAVADFLDPSFVVPKVNWGISNPPFSTATAFVEKLLDCANVRTGVAIFQRLTWIEGQTRYRDLFRDRPPHLFCPFVERVALAKGRWEPSGDTATAYAWFVWLKSLPYGESRTLLIPPCKDQLHRADDVRRWCPPAPMPLFEGCI
ncbi:hypothetical protein [Azorhizobium sp. AG788]|uniref:hypothetical protein n=1 Tax=Azorhizobium sp. AG788 TaxID=2183897 RepID=UPI0031397CA0